MERFESQTDHSTNEEMHDLVATFGQDGTTRLVAQISHNQPALTEDKVVQQAWSLISEAAAYTLPATQETLTESAISIHEGYEAIRRTQN
ncbi:hypothetical protein EON76_04755 [bacterium]|nr:MAG: hypothetical protein EON76_04755 [bacterium]